MHFAVDKHTIETEDNGSSSSFTFSQINNVRIIVTPTRSLWGRIGVYAWDRFHYAMIETNSNNMVIITSLMISNLQKFFDDLRIKVNLERKYFPVISEQISAINAT